MIDDKVKIKCSKCSLTFRERAHRIRNDFQAQCPHCIKLITFDGSSEGINIRRALRQARASQIADTMHRRHVAIHRINGLEYDQLRPFFFNDTATTEIYTLSLHDALPIYCDPTDAG